MIRVAIGRDLSFSGVPAREALVPVPDVVVLGEGWGAEDILRSARAGDLDVALIGLDMPGVGALEVLRRAARFPGVRILLVTAHAQRSYPGSLLRCGAVGHLTRRGRPAHLIEAVRAAYRGERYIAPDVADRVSQSLVDERQRSPFESFSPRQLQVAVLLARGCDTGEISRRLHLHAKTVNNHRRQVRARLGISDDAAITQLALEHGLLNPPDSTDLGCRSGSCRS
ncbi:MAG: LuxR C-terminal-related transcriptional regulator [Gammaproteobacteria bacterium]|jgi:two-component system, NarL family, invasion response regulator UvrY